MATALYDYSQLKKYQTTRPKPKVRNHAALQSVLSGCVWSRACLTLLLPVLLLTSLTGMRQANAQSATDFALLKEHIQRSFWDIPDRSNEQLATARPSASMIKQWTQSLQPNGSWNDINYADKTRDSWLTDQHLKRTLAMATAFAKNKASGRSDPTLRHAILSATDYWTANDFQNPNWWWNTIGMPNDLSDIMLLMEDEMSPSEKQAGLEILNRIKIGRTGQNLVWQAGIVFKTAVLEENRAMASQARAAILDQIAVTTEEGLQPDESFHQHGPQQQLGNYGLAFSGNMADWAYIWRGTPWAMPSAKVTILRNFLLQGEAIVVYRSTMDISACDRELFPNAPAGKGETVLNLLNLMAVADPGHAQEYRAAIAKDSDGNGDTSLLPPTLNKNFYRSDYVVQRRPAWYASVKMSSRRVIGEELVNGENLRGRYLADGAMFVYQTGDEYKNIFPVWDWRRLPGVTDASTGDDLKPAGKMETDFAGGVSNGVYGAAGLDYHRDGVSARKSWFFFDHEIICLGAGIHSDHSAELVTGIEQSLLQGKIFAAIGNRAATQQAASSHRLDDARWVWHNNRGYFFPKPQDVVVSGGVQNGNWRNVYQTAENNAVAKDVFSLWIDHENSTNPASYSYVVLPAATMQQVAEYATHPDIKILSNTPDVQAVNDRRLGLTMIMFFAPGKIKTTFGNITVDHPCAILLDKANGQVKLSISDPSQMSKSIQVTIKSKVISVDLPQNGDAGKSVQVTLKAFR